MDWIDTPDSYGRAPGETHATPRGEGEASGQLGASTAVAESADAAAPQLCGCCCTWCARMCNSPVLVIHGGSLPTDWTRGQGQ